LAEKKKNPIDKDKITETPHILPYAHTLGSAIIKPIDKARTKGLAMSAMYEQSETSLNLIKEQIELLAKQAQDIHNRIEISEKIYQADCNFKPIIGMIYHLYEKKDTSWVLSMISPAEWADNLPFTHIASIKLLSDHTWKIIDKS